MKPAPPTTPAGQARWRHYRTSSGRKPVGEFIDSLSDRHAAAIVDEMKKVRREGLHEARHLDGDIWEVRVSTSGARYRVLFSPEGKRGRVMLSLAAFQKQTQKTPPANIDLAKQRLGEWRRRGRTHAPAQVERGIER